MKHRIGSRGLFRPGGLLPMLISALFVAALWSNATAQDPVKKIKFIVMGDSQGKLGSSTDPLNTAIFTELINKIDLEENVNFVLFTGDLVNGSTSCLTSLKSWCDVSYTIAEKNIPILPVRGNHDLDVTSWKKIFGGVDAGDLEEKYKKFKLPSTIINDPSNEFLNYCYQNEFVTVVALDQFLPGLNFQVRNDWLEKLKTDNNISTPHVFFFGHATAFPLYYGENESLAINKNSRDLFLKYISDFGGITYFCGHEHFFSKSEIQPQPTLSNYHILNQLVSFSAGGALRWSENIKGNSSDWNALLNTSIKADNQTNINYGYTIVEVGDLDGDGDINHVKITPKYFTAPDFSNPKTGPLVEYALSQPRPFIIGYHGDKTTDGKYPINVRARIYPTGETFLGKKFEYWMLANVKTTSQWFYKNTTTINSWTALTCKDLDEFSKSFIADVPSGTLKDIITNFPDIITRSGLGLTDGITVSPNQTLTLYFFMDSKIDNHLSLQNDKLNHLFRPNQLSSDLIIPE
ncbi:metallophosphoesterase [bacterium]|nr:metallophosphoesterase [candidate division CSSED10-310 bacterium]